MKKSTLFRAACISVFSLCMVASASAVTIDFGPLTLPAGEYLGHTEDGFTIAPSIGTWRKIPGTALDPDFKYIDTVGTDFHSVQVTDGLFTMTSFDAAHLGGILSTDLIGYFADGFRDGTQVFNFNGTISNAPGVSFETINNPHPDVVVDQLIIGRFDGSSEMALDNIVLNVVSIPGAVWLLGSGLIGLVGLKRTFRK